MVKSDKKIYYHLLGVVILSYLVVFVRLDSFQFRWWDESLFAVNTYEMIHNGKFFSTYYEGMPDMFNSKPPMTSWLQMIFVKVIGFNELAIRLPSAISSFLCIVILFLFLAKNYNLMWAWLSTLILMTAQGFIHFHTTRTGDADAPLTLFLFVANLYFLRYILYGGNRNIFLLMLFLSFAFMTKMYIPLLFCPAYLIVLIKEKKVKDFVFNKAFISGVVIFIVSNFALMYMREMDSPGYFKKFFSSSEILYSVVHSHDEPWDFYLSNFYSFRFTYWFILTMLGVSLTFMIEEGKERKILFTSTMLCFIYLIVITISKTKLEWYDMPLYPYLAILAGFALKRLFEIPGLLGENKNLLRMMIIILAVFAVPYYKMFFKTNANIVPTGEKVLEANERYIYKSIKDHKSLDGFKVYQWGHNGAMLCYKYMLADKGEKIEIVRQPDFSPNDKVLVSNDSLKIQVGKMYKYDLVDVYEKANVILIKEKIQ